jgi:serine/threonine protein kinase
MPGTSKSRLGKYELLEEIGNGAEGKIFKARCVEPGAPGVAVGELVALKRLRQTGSDTQSEIFKRTTRILGALNHPNIVRYKDSFVWREAELDEEVYCLVTELLEGQTLKELMERNEHGLPWNRAQAILLSALQALEYAGNHSVIHRDLKPSNIYLTNQGDVKLIDFGIARHQDSGATTTSTAGPQGTWDYMAGDFVSHSDNFRGDQQSDIFSFGVCFYQSLTGELPYPPLGSNAQGAYYQRWMRPERLPQVKYSHPVFSILRGARTCVEKCVKIEREDRYRNFTEVLAAFKLIQRRKLQHGSEQYEYLDYIGKGGFGKVFRVRRMSDGLEVAIKEVLADRNATRFVREAKMLKIMRHPHLVQYLDFVEVSEQGMGEERRLFLVLEYLQGMPQAGLNYRIRTAPYGLDPVEVLPFFTAYLNCLDYLHRSRIIHRDIKPSNLYAPANAPERAKIFDLGIAHDTEGTKTHGQVPGTLDYMPYEFASQGGERGTAYSDIYSIGVTLYQALTGKLPFDRLPDDEKMAWITWYKRCEEPPEISFNHAVFCTHPELEKLLRRALAFHPQDRFDSADAMRQELQTFLDNWERAKRKEAYEKALAGARAAFGKQEYDEAVRHVRIALEVWPEGVEAGQLLGRIETERQRKTQYDTALTAAKEAVERGDLDAAARQVRIALEVWPEGVEARQVFDQLETERQRRTEYDTAITAAKRALGRDDLETAARQVRIALKVRPDGVEAIRLLDQIETQRQRNIQYDSAITAAKEALEQRDYAQALAQADVALELKPMDSTAQTLRARAEEAMRAVKEPEPKTVAPIEAPLSDDGPVTAVTEVEPPPEKPRPDIKPEAAIITEPVLNQAERTLAPEPTPGPGTLPPVMPPKQRKKSKVRTLLPIAASIVLAAVIAGGAYHAWQSAQKKPGSPPPSPILYPSLVLRTPMPLRMKDTENRLVLSFAVQDKVVLPTNLQVAFKLDSNLSNLLTCPGSANGANPNIVLDRRENTWLGGKGKITVSQAFEGRTINQTYDVEVDQLPAALVLYGPSTITHDISNNNPIRLACLARNSRLNFVPSNSTLLPSDNIRFIPANVAGKTNGWILLKPRLGYTGEVDILVTAAGQDLSPVTNDVHLTIVGQPTPPHLETAPGNFVLEPGDRTNIVVKVSSDYFASKDLSLINKSSDPPNLLKVLVQSNGDTFALEIQALQPGRVAIESLLEAPNGTRASNILFVTIRPTPLPWISGPPTNVIRSNGKSSQPIKLVATGRPPIAFEGGFGPELQRKYGLQWKSDAVGTNLIVNLNVEPPQDLQSTETFTAIVHDASRQRVTNTFIFQFVPRTNTWINSIGMKLAWVPNLPGCENSQWTDRANGGWVGLYEVTQDEFTQVLHTNPSKSRAAGNGKFPVESMPFEEATRFCEELTRRDGQLLPQGWHYALPTETQWEFFAAGTPVNTSYACYVLSKPKPTAPQEVGLLKANSFGLYDVLGNVAELTRTRWHYSANENETQFHICRGGGFDSASTTLVINQQDVGDYLPWMFSRPKSDIGFRVILIPP